MKEIIHLIKQDAQDIYDDIKESITVETLTELVLLAAAVVIAAGITWLFSVLTFAL